MELTQHAKSGQNLHAPSLATVLIFWITSNAVLVSWLLGDQFANRHLYQRLGVSYSTLEIIFFLMDVAAPIVALLCFRKYFSNVVRIGLLVCCCLALLIAYNEANQLRSQMQFSLDHEREFAHGDLVEGVIRPLISKIVEVYVAVLGDDNTGGSTYFTHLAINYMFDSATLIAAFALGTVILSPVSTWLCLFLVAFVAQTSIYPGRMGAAFIAGGFLWQLFLLASRRYVAAILCGFIISFMRTDVVFSTAFALLGMAWIEQRRPSIKEWGVFASLVIVSIAVPKILILLHPSVEYVSFLFTHGDYFTKAWVNILTLKLFVAFISPLLAIIIVTRMRRASRVVAIVGLPALAHLAMVFSVADFSETRLLGPLLGALAFVASERLGYLLQAPDAVAESGAVGAGNLEC